MDHGTIRLTETVVKGGCAAKLPAGQLKQILQNLALPKPRELLIGTEHMDDACLWSLDAERCLVQTLDFFTPIVDDARSFGAIAAANALSDVYAMGGEPKIALTILAFPTAKLPFEILEPLMAGALETITAAGACLAGGHSIDDETLKLGFSVTGFVDRQAAWSNAGAQAGDALILAKGLGTGTITSALKSKKATPEWVDAATRSMCTLNKTRDLLGPMRIHAATDVTGFGLGGHLLQLCRASQLKATIQVDQLPSLPGALTCLENGVLNKAHHSNAAYIKEFAHYENISEAQRWLTVDPQTSGGLLLAVAPLDADETVQRLRERFPQAAIIGQLSPGEASLTFV